MWLLMVVLGEGENKTRQGVPLLEDICLLPTMVLFRGVQAIQLLMKGVETLVIQVYTYNRYNCFKYSTSTISEQYKPVY